MFNSAGFPTPTWIFPTRWPNDGSSFIIAATRSRLWMTVE